MVEIQFVLGFFFLVSWKSLKNNKDPIPSSVQLGHKARKYDWITVQLQYPPQKQQTYLKNKSVKSLFFFFFRTKICKAIIRTHYA